MQLLPSNTIRQSADQRSKRRELNTKREEEKRKKQSKAVVPADFDGDDELEEHERDFLGFDLDRKIPNKPTNSGIKIATQIPNLSVIPLNTMVQKGEEQVSESVTDVLNTLRRRNEGKRIPYHLMKSQKRKGPATLFATQGSKITSKALPTHLTTKRMKTILPLGMKKKKKSTQKSSFRNKKSRS